MERVTITLDKFFVNTHESKKTGKPFQTVKIVDTQGNEFSGFASKFKECLGHVDNLTIGQDYEIDYIQKGQYKNIETIKEAGMQSDDIPFPGSDEAPPPRNTSTQQRKTDDPDYRAAAMAKIVKSSAGYTASLYAQLKEELQLGGIEDIAADEFIALLKEAGMTMRTQMIEGNKKGIL